MSCNKCGKKKCGCPDGSGGVTTIQLSQQIAQLNDEVGAITSAVQAFLSGHPILMLQNADDVSCFDTTTGYGSNTWLGWGLCNGNTYLNPYTNKNLISPNLIDKFIVGAGGTYALGATGGAATVSLTAAQNGAHSHTIVDAGHTHNIVDPGHNHGITDPGHTHGGSSTPHSHTLTIGNNNTDHNHSIPAITTAFNTYPFASSTLQAWDNSTHGASGLESSPHTHNGVANPASATVSIQNAFTGIIVNDAFIGITETENNTTGITINNSGAGDPHENLPPYYALVFVIKF